MTPAGTRTLRTSSAYLRRAAPLRSLRCASLPPFSFFTCRTNPAVQRFAFAAASRRCPAPQNHWRTVQQRFTVLILLRASRHCGRLRRVLRGNTLRVRTGTAPRTQTLYCQCLPARCAARSAPRVALTGLLAYLSIRDADIAARRRAPSCLPQLLCFAPAVMQVYRLPAPGVLSATLRLLADAQLPAGRFCAVRKTAAGARCLHTFPVLLLWFWLVLRWWGVLNGRLRAAGRLRRV